MIFLQFMFEKDDPMNNRIFKHDNQLGTAIETLASKMTLLDFNGNPKYDLDLLNERFSEIDFNQLVFKKPEYDWDPVYRTNLKTYHGK